MKRRALTRAAFALLLATCALSMSGCLESPVLVNYVLDPSSDNIDYDNPQKHYVADPTATLTSQDIAAATNMTVEEVEEVLYDDPIYDDEKEETTEQPAQSATYQPTQESQTTTPKQVENDKSKKKNKNNANVTSRNDGGDGGNWESTDKSDVGKGAVDPKQKGNEAGSANQTDEGSGGGTEAPNDDEQGTESGTGEGTGVDPKDDPDSDNDAKVTEPGLVYNGRGKVENLPTDLKNACAVGDAAVIVAAIAGTDCLAGADSDFTTSATMRTVFGADALDNIATCWNGDGTKADDILVQSIVKCKPSAVLTISGSQDVDKTAQEELRKAGISIVALPQLCSDSYIRKAVRAVGRLFSDETGGTSADKAELYSTRVQSVLDAAMATHGGSVSTFNGIDYDNVTDPTPTRENAGSATNWTVLLTGWDEDATASAYFNGATIFQESGVALAQVGWRWSPVSYYLGCGGAVNNAAAYASYSSDSVRPFLNYNENQIRYEWNGLDDSVSTGKEGGTFKQGGTFVLTNACDAQGSDLGHYLGSADFNKVIAANKTIRKNLVEARKKPLGLYTPGSYATTPSISGYGIVLENQLLRCYSVVKDESRGDTLYDIAVNPCGLVGSWVNGSMESFLEAAWAACEFCDYDEAALRQDIAAFYEDFYGYTLSDSEIDDILDGSYAE